MMYIITKNGHKPERLCCVAPKLLLALARLCVSFNDDLGLTDGLMWHPQDSFAPGNPRDDPPWPFPPCLSRSLKRQIHRFPAKTTGN